MAWKPGKGFYALYIQQSKDDKPVMLFATNDAQRAKGAADAAIRGGNLSAWVDDMRKPAGVRTIYRARPASSQPPTEEQP